MEGFKILSGLEREKVIYQSQEREVSVYFKYVNTGVYKTNVMYSGSKRTFTCQRPMALAKSFSGQQVTMNFVVNSEVYFVVTFASIDGRNIHFNIDTEVYHLARRKTQRVRITKETDANLMIKRLGGQLAFLRGIMMDLSAGGCRVALNTDNPVVVAGQKIEGTIKVAGCLPIAIEGLVKYQKGPVRREFKQVFGIEFKDLKENVILDIRSLVMDLQREYILRVLE